MSTLEIKKEVKGALKELEINIKLNDKLIDIINEYVEFVEKNIPDEFMESFGIGVAGSHDQFGSHYGFESTHDYSGERVYRVAGHGYNIANDFNAYVTGSNFTQMLEFAKQIPKFINYGVKVLKNNNEAANNIIEKLREIEF
jgi:hypothetical protein